VEVSKCTRVSIYKDRVTWHEKNQNDLRLRVCICFYYKVASDIEWKNIRLCHMGLKRLFLLVKCSCGNNGLQRVGREVVVCIFVMHFTFCIQQGNTYTWKSLWYTFWYIPRFVTNIIYNQTHHTRERAECLKEERRTTNGWNHMYYQSRELTQLGSVTIKVISQVQGTLCMDQH